MTMRHTVLGTVLTTVLSLSAAAAMAAGMNMDHGSMQGMQGMDHSAHMNMNAASTATYKATGVVKAVTKSSVKIHHSAVKELNWGAMTMNFGLKGYKGPQLAVGDKIAFTFVNGETGPVLVSAKKEK